MTNRSNSTQDTLMERLEGKRGHEFGRGLLGEYLNPDGPEAAALIRELVEALEAAAWLVRVGGVHVSQMNLVRERAATLKAKAQQ